MQEVIRTLDATRAEQQELYLRLEENEDELVQLRQLRATRSAQGDGQTVGLPTQSVLFGGSTSVPNQGVQQQQVPSQADHQIQFEQAFEHWKRTGCVPVPAAPTYVPNVSVPANPSVPEGFAGMPTMTAPQGLQLPEVLPAPTTVPVSVFPVPSPNEYLFNTPPRTAMFPTIGQLQAPSSSSLPSTNVCSGFGGAANTAPSQGGSVPGSVPEPMAASARAAPGPSQPATGPSLNELRKAKTTLPALQFQGTSVVNLIRTWKEWTLRVQEAMAAWHETAPAYWLQVLKGATGLYSRYCTLSATHKTLFEANEQIDVVAGGGYSDL
eukprot:6478508-Amphidinium_carterae.1